MSEKPKKVIFTADAHWGEKKYDEATQSKFKPQDQRVEPDIPDANWVDKVFDRYRRGNERRFELLLREVQKVGNVDYLFFGGDMVSGYGERGLSGPNSQEAIREFKAVVDRFISSNVSKKYVAGDHELGYYLPWSWDEKGGINEKAIEMFEGNFNELFYTFQEGQYKFIILSSDLELVTPGMRGATDGVLKKKKEQQEFYKDTISEMQRDEKIVLMMHDPDALNPMFSFLEQHLAKMEKTIVGHHHAEWITALNKFGYSLASTTLGGKSMQFLKKYILTTNLEHALKYKDNARIWKEMKLVTIPAPGGNFGIGGGFLVGLLNEDGLEIQKHRLPTDFGLITGR